MKKALLVIVLLAFSGLLFGIDAVKVVVTLKDGRVFEREVSTEKIGKRVTKVTIPAKAIPADCKYMDIIADNATAKKGDDGFWLYNRGLLGYFNKDNATHRAPRQYMYLPYFAMKTPKETFIGVIDGMRFEFGINIDVVDGVYTMYPRWYIDGMGFAPYEDITITFYSFGKKADYNKMAKAYRKHRFAQNKNIKPLKERFKTQPYLEKMAKSVPVRMNFARKPFNAKTDSINFYPRGGKPFEDEKYGIKALKEEYPVKGWSFEGGIATLQMLKDLGMDDIAVCVSGFQTGGYDGRCPTTFPICEEAGGEESLKKLIKAGQDMGFIIDGHSNYTDAFTCSPDWSPDNISKSPEGKLELNGTWSGGRAYNLCLINAYEKYIKRDLERLASLGFRGAHYIDVFTAVYPYRCYDPKHSGNRKQVGEIQDKIAQLCREKFGGFASECGFDHIIDKVDYINYVTAPMRAKYVYKSKSMEFVDEFVPFWELVYHDVVLHNTDKITQEWLSRENNLILVEFGGRPIFYHVSKSNIRGIKIAYDQFQELRHLMIEEMKSHKKLADGVARVKYGNGDVVIVNKSDKPFVYEGNKINAKSFKLIKAK